MVACTQTPLKVHAAFMAEFCGESAVVCLVFEDCPEPDIKPEFGEFETWTQANAVAIELNNALGINCLEARRIVVAAMLGRNTKDSGSAQGREELTLDIWPRQFDAPPT